MTIVYQFFGVFFIKTKLATLLSAMPRVLAKKKTISKKIWQEKKLAPTLQAEK